MNDYKISIIIPVFNAGKYLSDCLDSILSQDFQSFEVILVDDGSIDSSPDVCDRYASVDHRIKVIHKENGGVSAARNDAIYRASGEYLMFVDADDTLSPGSLSALYVNDVDFVLGGFEKISDGKVIETYLPSGTIRYVGEDRMGEFFDANMMKENCYLLNSPWCKLYRRDKVISNELRFASDLSYAEDKIFVLSFLLCADSVATVNKVVYRYNLIPGSLSSDSKSDRHLRQVMVLLRYYYPLYESLLLRFGNSERVLNLYHRDFISRYVCRILTEFAARKSELMTSDNIALLYSYMDKDDKLGIFSIRFGQIPNILLYKIGSPSFSEFCYSIISGLNMLFHKFTRLR